MSTVTRIPRPEALPVSLTSLVGRDREVASIREMLDDPSLRLVTLTGPGGVGKTRLALHVADGLGDAFGDAIAWVSLATVHEESLVLPLIAMAIDIPVDPSDSLGARLASHLERTPWLLVLDNLEQLPDVGIVVSDLLGLCPRLTILATSRTPLGVAGEQQFSIQPLPMPGHEDTPDSMRQSDAVRLFMQRARAASPAIPFDDAAVGTVAEICRRVDGLPLAIELAAARTSMLSPEALLGRLADRFSVLGGMRRDVPERLRTMRNAIAWSHELLAPHEQATFRRLSVFVGGFSLDAAERVAEARGDMLDLVSSLVDHSLVRPEYGTDAEPRFLMLETIRDFGLDQLERAGETSLTRRAHATWVAELAERAEPGLIGADAPKWLHRLDRDRENIRAAIEWALDAGESQLALRIGAAIWRYAGARGIRSDGRSWLDRALTTGAGSDHLRARAMVGAGYLAEYQRDLDPAWQWFEEGLALAEAEGDRFLMAGACVGLGTVAQDRGDYAWATQFHNRAVALGEAIGDARVQAIALGNLANIAYYQGRLQDASHLLVRCMEMFTTLGDTQKQALCACNLGAVLQERGDHEAAIEYLERALTLQRELDAERDLPVTLVNIGQNAVHRGELARALEAYREGLERARVVGNASMEGTANYGLAVVSAQRGSVSTAAAHALEAARNFDEADDQLSSVELAELVATLVGRQGDHATVIELLAAADNARRALDAERHPTSATEISVLETSARAALSTEEHNIARERGRQLELSGLTRRVASVAREIAGPSRPTVVTGLSGETAPPNLVNSLTRREREVLGLLVEGCSTVEIADALFISPRTAGTHIAHIIAKLGVSSRTAAVSLALRSNLA